MDYLTIYLSFQIGAFVSIVHKSTALYEWTTVGPGQSDQYSWKSNDNKESIAEASNSGAE